MEGAEMFRPAYQSTPNARQLFIARVVFFVLGIAVLLPWHSYITATDYFGTVFSGWHIDRLISIVYLTANLATVVLGLCFHKLVNGLPKPHRVVVPLSGYALSLALVPLLDHVLLSREAGTMAFLVVVVAGVGACGICDGIIQPAILAEAACVSLPCVQSLSAGLSASGLMVSSLRLLAKGIGGELKTTLRTTAMVYFDVTVLGCLFALLGYMFVLRRLEVCIKPGTGGAAALDDHDRLVGSSAPGNAPLHSKTSDPAMSDSLWPSNSPCSGDPGLQRHSTSGTHIAAMEMELKSTFCSECGAQTTPAAYGHVGSPSAKCEACQTPGPSLANARAGASRLFCLVQLLWLRLPPLLRRIASPATALFLSFAVTLTIFPGMIAEDMSSATLGSWYPVLLFFLFGLGDFTGRWLPPPSCQWTLWLSVGRIVFLPLFTLAARFHAAPAVVAALTTALALTNGAVANAAFMHGTSKAGVEHADTAGSILVLSLMLGLFSGSWLSWLWLL